MRFVTLLLLVAMFAAPVHAQDDLRAVIADADPGATIQVFADQRLDAPLVIDKPLTLEGGTYAGDSVTRLFEVAEGVEFTLRAVTLEDGRAARGGAIYNAGDLTLVDAVIRNNSAGIEGGGIYNEGTLTLIDTALDSNAAGTHGGGIYNAGGDVTIDLTGSPDYDDFVQEVSRLNNNFAQLQDGGAIYNDGGTLMVRATQFESNSASEGGAVYNAGGDVVLDEVLVSGVARGNGGGIFNDEAGTLRIVDSRLTGRAEPGADGRGGDGGAIYNAGDLVLASGEMVAAQAWRAGDAIYNSGTAAIDGTVFRRNDVFNAGDLVVEDTTFTCVTDGDGTAEGVACDPPPTPTPEPEACPGLLAPRLSVGERGRVTPGAANRLRADPTTSAEQVGAIPGGAVFEVLDGPVCAEGFTWWQVGYDGTLAWTVEGDAAAYFTEPE